jgi:hypothetical protein
LQPVHLRPHLFSQLEQVHLLCHWKRRLQHLHVHLLHRCRCHLQHLRVVQHLLRHQPHPGCIR